MFYDFGSFWIFNAEYIYSVSSNGIEIIYLIVVYKFTSIIYPNNHVKLSVKNKPQRAHQLSTKATIYIYIYIHKYTQYIYTYILYFIFSSGAKQVSLQAVQKLYPTTDDFFRAKHLSILSNGFSAGTKKKSIKFITKKSRFLG